MNAILNTLNIMSKNICITQTKAELENIYSLIKEEYCCVPLNLETYLFCLDKKIQIINVSDLLPSNFHEELQLASHEFSLKFSYNETSSLAINTEIIAALRYTYNSIILVLKILTECNARFGINRIYVSGWNKAENYIFSEHNYFISEVVLKFGLTNHIQVVPLDVKSTSFSYKTYSYQTKIKKLKNKNILLNSTGYNFHRLAIMAMLNNFNSYSIAFRKQTTLQKLKYLLLRHKVIYFEQVETGLTEETDGEFSFLFEFDKIDITSIIKNRYFQVKNHANDLKNKRVVVTNFLEANKPHFIFSYSTRGFDGMLLEIGKEINVPSMSISHGTVSESYNIHDKIYKQIIADAVFSGQSTYHALQTKIADKSARSIITMSTGIITGNLIFAGRKGNRSKKYFLYCVTLKDFYNIQFYGVEFFTEFLKNLEKLNSLATNVKYPIIIKLHPSQIKFSKDLSNIFENLEFEVRSIKKLLPKTSALISFSSTAIEDALTSRVPVVLFDPHKRYQHCRAESDSFKEDAALYYVNSEKDLLNVLNTIKKSRAINFNQYIYNFSTYFNIYKLFDQFGLTNRVTKPFFMFFFNKYLLK